MWKTLSINRVSKRFEANGTDVLTDISMTIPRGGFACALGPSGCGKTTLLNIIAGFEAPSDGEVAYDDRRITGPGPDRVVVFQDMTSALFPWLNVQENVAFGLKARSVPKEQVDEAVYEALKLVGMSNDVHKFPYQLSGGMKQRVQIARAFASDPEVILMDEPFAALDAINKRILLRELGRIWQETQKTVFYITHDIQEALALATQVAVMSSGPNARIKEQFDLTPEVRDDPQSVRQHAEWIETLLQEEVVGRSNE